jgi:hypothetical protein
MPQVTTTDIAAVLRGFAAEANSARGFTGWGYEAGLLESAANEIDRLRAALAARDELTTAVREMRRAQKAYFANPTPANLGTAKVAERLVDRMLDDMASPGLFPAG